MISHVVKEGNGGVVKILTSMLRIWGAMVAR